MAKLLILISLFLTSDFVLAQENSSKELRKVIKDSANYFQHFKSAFKEMLIDDSVYLSSINITGTKENRVITCYFRKDTMIYSRYNFIVTDSIKEKEGKRIISDWKDMLILQLGYDVEMIKQKKSHRSYSYGWTFRKGRFWVDIGLYKNDYNSSVYLVALDFTFFAPGWQRHIDDKSFHKLK